MKRSPMPARSKPLERKTSLVASPLARSSVHAAQAREGKTRARRPKLQIPTRIRLALAVRSEGKCEIAAPGCTGVATDLAHRKKVGAGGRKGAAAKAHHVLSNALAACRACHGLGHANPAEAYAAGWMLREHQNPISEPVLYRGLRRWLTDDGLVLTTDPTAEEAL